MDKKRVWISAGIILNDSKDSVFITRRPAKAHKGGFWEFAGGKVEQGETAEQAVIRELHEEVGIEATALEHFMALEHDYPEKALKFDFFLVTAFEGEAFGKEGQPGEWVALSNLRDYTFPEANEVVLDKLMGL
ncbi:MULTISPECIES: 8-oxo-dGTP diphosphatase MutT [Photobacterium]|uniref:8-oxo-dGTP diphosphatase n=1 Tax=Photobacterium ganghwense TaxID=320778 RepID=A0A0J1H3H9_9GAMM|nr:MULTISPECIES: 8-oxo-dGTP diphosphatase MutT [Photobacterium]KLV06341.1 7,8-dihydro-8-oxoguanine-triphosphatase [Photobacterium ganghwense]PSU06705.1 8-oxo-dGTP diphosphatase MutT [Photobacterium ganghwense]QSV14449.1 8-oxo-dGTP diphosphatase MutT [Photobacterium ganghwense]